MRYARYEIANKDIIKINVQRSEHGFDDFNTKCIKIKEGHRETRISNE